MGKKKKKNSFVGKRISTKLIDYVLIRKIVNLFGNDVELDPYKQDGDFLQIGFSPKLIDLIAKNKLKEGELKILFYILSKVKRDEGTVALIVSNMAGVFGFSEQKVRDTINKFKHLGLLKKINGRGNAHTYDINPFLVFNGNRIQYLEDLGFRGLNRVKTIIKYL